MDKETAWQRHVCRVIRLRNADDKKAEAMRLRDELIAEGVPEEIAGRAVRESWNFAKGGRAV